jgi:hypothetical protein
MAELQAEGLRAAARAKAQEDELQRDALEAWVEAVRADLAGDDLVTRLVRTIAITGPRAREQYEAANRVWAPMYDWPEKVSPWETYWPWRVVAALVPELEWTPLAVKRPGETPALVPWTFDEVLQWFLSQEPGQPNRRVTKERRGFMGKMKASEVPAWEFSDASVIGIKGSWGWSYRHIWVTNDGDGPWNDGMFTAAGRDANFNGYALTQMAGILGMPITWKVPRPRFVIDGYLRGDPDHT